MSVDFPRAWEICKAVPRSDPRHDKKCSWRTHGMLCDCSVLFQHPDVLDPFVFYGAGRQIIKDNRPRPEEFYP